MDTFAHLLALHFLAGGTRPMLPSSPKSMGEARRWEELENGASAEIRGACVRCTQSSPACKRSIGFPRKGWETPLPPSDKDIHCFGALTAQHPEYLSQSIASVWHRAGSSELSATGRQEARAIRLNIHILAIHISFSALQSFSLELRGEGVSTSNQNEKDNESSLHHPPSP